MNLITQKEYAKRIGKTPQYVNKLVQQGKIPLVKGRIDAKKADRARTAWARAGNDTKSSHRSTKKPKGRKAAAPSRYSSGSRPQSATGTLTQARARRELAQAQMAEMELKLKEGTLLPSDQVLLAERRKNERIRQRFRSLPRRIAPLLAREMAPAEVELLLRKEIDVLLGELAADPLGLKDDAPVLSVQTPAPAEAATV